MTYYNTWKFWLLKNIQLQLFLSLISLPFLIMWGLPFSVMSLFSTLIFGPFLTIFLLISSLIFLLELCYMPNSAIIWCLEKTTSLWSKILSINDKLWLLALRKPNQWWIIVFITTSLAIIHSKKIKSLELRTACLTLLLSGILASLIYFPYNNGPIITRIPYNTKNITLMTQNKTIVLIDPGTLGSRPSYESWISFTLLPELVKKTGRLSIDHLVLCNINQRTFEAVTFLLTKIEIKNLYLPWWTGKIPPFAWNSYMKLKNALGTCNGISHAISKPTTIFISEESSISIAPDDLKKVDYYDATYITLMVTSILNNENNKLSEN